MKKIIHLLVAVMCCAGGLLHADERDLEQQRTEARNAVNNQLIQEMNVKLLNASLFSRRMPQRFYSAEVAEIDAASLRFPFTIWLHDSRSLEPAPVDIATGYYDHETKSVMVNLNGRAVPPKVFVQSLLDKTI